MSGRIVKFNSSHVKNIKEIHNYYAENSFAEPSDQPADDNFSGYLLHLSKDGFPIFSVTSKKGKVIGYAFIQPYSHAKTLNHVGLISIFLMPNHVNRGTGAELLRLLEEKALLLRMSTLLASIISKNEPSLLFFRKHGYDDAGCIKAAVKKFDTVCDLIWLQKHL